MCVIDALLADIRKGFQLRKTARGRGDADPPRDKAPGEAITCLFEVLFPPPHPPGPAPPFLWEALSDPTGSPPCPLPPQEETAMSQGQGVRPPATTVLPGSAGVTATCPAPGAGRREHRQTPLGLRPLWTDRGRRGGACPRGPTLGGHRGRLPGWGVFGSELRGGEAPAQAYPERVRPSGLGAPCPHPHVLHPQGPPEPPQEAPRGGPAAPALDLRGRPGSPRTGTSRMPPPPAHRPLGTRRRRSAPGPRSGGHPGTSTPAIPCPWRTP